MRAGDLFCGCGGLSLGLIEAEIEVPFAADSWVPAIESYAKNVRHAPARMDLSDIVEVAFRLKRIGVDLIVGGPPCQDFSSANRAYFDGDKREGDRASLTLAFAEVIRAVESKWFIYENVPEAANSRAYENARSLLSDAGYGITEVTLNAAYFGVPQLRKRFFAVGCIGEMDNFLDQHLLGDAAEQALTVRGYLGDEFNTQFYYRHPRTWDRKAIYSIDESAATIRSTNRPIPATYKGHPRDAASRAEARPLTPEERARLQTFPRGSHFFGFNVDRETMIANAVPVRLACHIGQAILRFERESGLMNKVAGGFNRWLVEEKGLTARSAGNVASRLRRVHRILGLQAVATADSRDVIHDLSKHTEFEGLTISVRSQLRRAVQLHCEFVTRQ